MDMYEPKPEGSRHLATHRVECPGISGTWTDEIYIVKYCEYINDAWLKHLKHTKPAEGMLSQHTGLMFLAPCQEMTKKKLSWQLD